MPKPASARGAATARLQLASAASLALLSACAVGPDYVRPAAPTVGRYDREAEQRLGAGAAGPIIRPGGAVRGDWWATLGSSKLDQVMAQVTRGNFDLAAADARIAQAAEAVTAARGGLFPQIDYGAQVGGARSSGAPRAFTAGVYALGPRVSYDFDLFGGVRRGVELQTALAEGRTHRFEAAYLALTGEVADQALRLASTRALIEAVETLIADDRATLDLLRQAHETGAATQVDVALAESQLAQDQTLLPPLIKAREAARHALSVLAGKAPAEWAPPDFDLADFTLPQDLPVELPSELARRRPDILQAEAELHAASAAVGIATADLYPRLTLSGSIAEAASGPGSLAAASATLWSLAAGVAGPAFHGGALKAERRAAMDGYQAALADYRQTVVRALGQVADVLQAIDHDGDEYRSQQRALEAAAASLRLNREGYRAGEVGVLQVLDSKRAYQRALLGEIQARTARLLDAVELSVALGGGAAGAFERTRPRNAPRESPG
jgi:NodT family efflux transporter outer membrane factor (OMF) lipoprotein